MDVNLAAESDDSFVYNPHVIHMRSENSTVVTGFHTTKVVLNDYRNNVFIGWTPIS